MKVLEKQAELIKRNDLEVNAKLDDMFKNN
jgi:hypothetical protein